jgi:hypothetical protein
MGQYWRAFVMSNEGSFDVFDIETKDGKETLYHGVKLMEHSYWTHPFCVSLAASLYCNPKKVAWIGDYAKEEECEAATGGKGMKVIWGSRYAKPFILNKEFDMDKPKYLINNTKKVFVDLVKYKKESETNNQYDIIHPIPLLTAVGNDRGGGDFHKRSAKKGYDKVGTWAGNEIYLADDVPEGYTEEEVAFVED